MIADLGEKIKEWGRANRADIFLFVSIVLISLASFGLGRLSVIWQPHAPIQITKDGAKAAVSTRKEVRAETKGESRSYQESESTVTGIGTVVASKNGSSYHLPTCSGAKNIKPENLIKFNSAAEARAAGYKPAGNCPGLEE